MASLKAVRNGVETRLDTIDGLRIVDGASINPPAAVVMLATDGVNYHETFKNGLSQWNLRVVVYVSTAYTRTARDLLDDFCDTTGSKSVKAAIEGDRTLGGIIDDLVVSNASQSDFQFQEGGVLHQYLGAEFFVTVLAS